MSSPNSPAQISAFLGRILKGDCISVMRTMPDQCVDLVVTDPPYLVDFRTLEGRSAYPNDKDSQWLQPAFAEIYRLLKQDSLCVCFYGWPKAERFLHAWKKAGFQPVSHLVFVKRYSSKVGFTKARHETAYLLAKGDPYKPEAPPNDVFAWPYERNSLHPAQKPVSVLKNIITAFSKPGAVVLDPFAGSGTTGVAAFQTGREYVLIEMVWRYFKIARNRLIQMKGNQSRCQRRNPKFEGSNESSRFPQPNTAMKTNQPTAPTANKPAHEIRVSGIRATIWKNQTEKGSFFNTTFERSYRDGDQWKTSDSFGRDDLLVVAHIASEAFRWIAQQQPSI